MGGICGDPLTCLMQSAVVEALEHCATCDRVVEVTSVSVT